MKRWLTLFIICLMLTGCWDRREVNDVALVVGSAIDKEKDEFAATVQIPLPSKLGGPGSKGGGGGNTGDKTYYLSTETGRNIREANEKQQATLSRILNFSHRRIFLIGEELAKEGIGPIMDELARVPQNRMTAYVAVTQGPARNLLGVDAPIENTPSEMIRELMGLQRKQPVMIRNVADWLLSEGIDASIPEIARYEAKQSEKGNTKSTIKVNGLALFKNGKQVAVLKGDDMNSIFLATNQASKPTINLNPPEGNGKISVRIQENNTNFKSKVEGERIVMQFEISGRATVLEDQSNYDLYNINNMNSLQKKINNEIKTRMEQVITMVQTKYQVDPIGFGRKLQEEHPQLWESMKSEWNRVYPQINVEVVSKVRLENVGSILSPIGRKTEELVH